MQEAVWIIGFYINYTILNKETDITWIILIRASGILYLSIYFRFAFEFIKEITCKKIVTNKEMNEIYTIFLD